jgi:hypothetical protein
MEELFFFQYHMRMSKVDCMGLPVHERKWLIQRFVEQKKKENDAIDRAKKSKKH